jgi:hypothetical protein
MVIPVLFCHPERPFVILSEAKDLIAHHKRSFTLDTFHETALPGYYAELKHPFSLKASKSTKTHQAKGHQ